MAKIIPISSLMPNSSIEKLPNLLVKKRPCYIDFALGVKVEMPCSVLLSNVPLCMNCSLSPKLELRFAFSTLASLFRRHRSEI